uniref:Ig-like domain-containing protein n=1 Tax=Maylandia zebra TaxID=106582 RepID=A0A3P9DHQ4_9CICH
CLKLCCFCLGCSFHFTIPLLSVLASVSSGTFVVTQSPDVSVMEGETVNITCCWTGKFKRFRVYWLKNQTVIRSDYFINQPNAFLKKEEKKCSSLNISSVRTEDSGTYICKVTAEIPSLTEAKGNGTVITVKAKKKKDKRNREEVKKDDNTDQHIGCQMYGLRATSGLGDNFIYLLLKIRRYVGAESSALLRNRAWEGRTLF